jgi:hypothetical protein
MHHGRHAAPARDEPPSAFARRVASVRAFLADRARPMLVALAAGAAVLLSGTLSPATWYAFGRTPVAPDDRAAMATAERTVDSLRAAAYSADRAGARQHPLSDAALLALAYHERLRLGVGSPFRLADDVRSRRPGHLSRVPVNDDGDEGQDPRRGQLLALYEVR